MLGKWHQVLDLQASRSAACMVESNCVYTWCFLIYLIRLPDHASEQALQKCKITYTVAVQEERKSFNRLFGTRKSSWLSTEIPSQVRTVAVLEDDVQVEVKQLQRWLQYPTGVLLSCILKIMLISQSINRRKKYNIERKMARGWPTSITFSLTAVNDSPVLQEAPWSASSTVVGSLNLTFGPGRTQKPVVLGLDQIPTEVSDQTASDESHAVDLGFSPSHETERSRAFSFSWHSLPANTDITVPSCTGRRNIAFETSKMKS